MFAVIFKIWYMVVVLPFLILIEGSRMFGRFLKSKNIYSYWDMWHTVVLILIILYIILWAKGYR